MPSRRQVLGGLAGVAAVGLAGCSGAESGGSSTVDCQTSAVEHGDGEALDGGAQAWVEDDDVRLAVPLSVETVRERDVDSLELRDQSGAVAHVVPVSADDADRMATKPGVGDGQLRYEQYLGERPFHGRYRVVAVDADGGALDSVTVEFNCFPDADE